VSAPVPPRAERLLRWSLSPLERQAILGDLQEDHASIAQAKGAVAARRWYWHQVLSSIAPNLWRRLRADQRRSRLFYSGLWTMAIGLSWGVIALFPRSEPAMMPFFWPFYFLSGATQSAVGLCKKRLNGSKRRLLVARWSLGALCLTGFAAAYWNLVTITEVAWTISLIGLVVAALPNGPDERAEARVQMKGASPTEARAWSFDLPTEPLGLSGLVLHRPRPGISREPDRLPPVTIERTFAPQERIRLRAAVNLGHGGEQTSVELLDSQGKQVWQAQAPLTTGTLVEVPASLDDIADRDPGDHFGLIDQALSFEGLALGRYRLRVTVTDGIQSSSADEVITIAPPQKP